jgi:hypothetical protein
MIVLAAFAAFGVARAETVLFAGTVEELSVWREKPEVPEGWVRLDGPCGRYRVTFSVLEVLGGHLPSETVSAEGWLEYCRLFAHLTYSYLVEIETGEVNEIIGLIELLETEEGQFGGKPEVAELRKRQINHALHE